MVTEARSGSNGWVWSVLGFVRLNYVIYDRSGSSRHKVQSIQGTLQIKRTWHWSRTVTQGTLQIENFALGESNLTQGTLQIKRTWHWSRTLTQGTPDQKGPVQLTSSDRRRVEPW
jgi:hypothetical protein